MMEPLTLAIGVGLFVCLVFIEYLGLTVGGLVVPGYLALNYHMPWSLLFTLITALVSFGVIEFFSSYLILFGRRRVILTVLVAFVLGVLGRKGLEIYALWHEGDVQSLTIIGYIIPGLIALALEREGLWMTVTSLLTASVMVRLILLLILGNEAGL